MKAPYAQRIEAADLAIRIMANNFPDYRKTILDALAKASRTKNSPLGHAIKLEHLRDQTSRLVYPLGNQTPRS
jgi:hypothetical protein